MQRFMTNLSRFMAILGGIVLTALIILVCVSVLGRTLNGFLHSEPVVAVLGDFAKTLLDAGVGPILGDFELVEAGVAFAIFAFIPFCQITGGHATVDIFTSMLPLKANRLLQMVIDIVFAGVLILIAMQLYEGMLSKMQYRETTFLLQFPVWWSYAASLVAAVVSAIVSVYIAIIRMGEFFGNRTILSIGGADH
ncbi:TRAP transporter small permease [Seohaeicola saemankumensis]|jgi:TRAP-type C4-dicarboxylate transport system permease small subunit|uniref:TRAP transporter small permease n=2 Tax=Seohaeicola TaxID=481178 RepID=UPI0007F3AF9C|nr:C4-dicarboxylate ABC transporter permease [Rhodobacteraceae bacterium EhC02]